MNGYLKVKKALSGIGLEILAREEKRKKEEEEIQKLKLKKTIELTNSQNLIIKSFKHARDLMALPMFSTKKRKIMENIEYKFNLRGQERYLVVSADKRVDIGIANERDADILRYGITKIYNAAMDTGIVTNRVGFTRYELLKAIGKPHNTKGYKWIRESIRRISTTNYDTNIWTNRPNDFFSGNLASFYYRLDEKKEIKRIEMILCDPLYQHIKNNQMLTISEEIIKDESYFRKKVKQVVQVSMGKSSQWTVSINKLRELTAYRETTRRIKQELNRIKLPYNLHFFENENSKTKLVTFSKK